MRLTISLRRLGRPATDDDATIAFKASPNRDSISLAIIYILFRPVLIGKRALRSHLNCRHSRVVMVVEHVVNAAQHAA